MTDGEFEDALALVNGTVDARAGRAGDDRDDGSTGRTSGGASPRTGAFTGSSPGDYSGSERSPGPTGQAGPTRQAGQAGRVGQVGQAGRAAQRAGHTPWEIARAVAAEAATGPLEARRTPLAAALGRVLAAPLTALTDLPSFDTSAMDGWAVAGPGPWRIAPQQGGILAGQECAETLPDGRAVRIATGARIPPGATAVLRSEHGTIADAGGRYEAVDTDTDAHAHTGVGGDAGEIPTAFGASGIFGASGASTPSDGASAPSDNTLRASRPVPPGQDIRPRGQECRRGDQLLPAGAVVTPAVLGLAAAAGYDELLAHPRPRVEIFVLGDELLRAGLPHDGRIRDALGPMLTPWFTALGAEVTPPRHLADRAEALYAAIAESTADLVVTTGGTAAGPVDHVHPTLRRLGAELLVDGVEARPGHPMLLARLRSGSRGSHVVGLPGNPLAAVSGLLTLAEPLLRTLAGRRTPTPYRAPLADAVHGHPRDTRLVPVTYREDGSAAPLHFSGPAMLRGIAAADALAVIPPGGTDRGAEAELLDLPWALTGQFGDQSVDQSLDQFGDQAGDRSGDRPGGREDVGSEGSESGSSQGPV